MMVVCEEMQKLRNWLNDSEIKWKDVSEDAGDYSKGFDRLSSWIVRTQFSINDKNINVINGFGTYGGFYLFENTNAGLLELLVDREEPIGHLTCRGVIEELKNQEVIK